MPQQHDWRWCRKCQGLFFGGRPGSRCPAGGAHERAGSSNYSLAFDLPATNGWQSDWRWCNKCQGLFFGGRPDPSCPAGGVHERAGSSNYSLRQASVIVDRMALPNSGDEWGSEDVYMLTFRGSVPADGGVNSETQFTVRGPGAYWNNFTNGDVRNRDIAIAAYEPDSLYIVSLIEEDGERDVTEEIESAYRTGLDVVWTAALARTVGQSINDRIEVLASAVIEALHGTSGILTNIPVLGDDDQLGRPQRLVLPTNSLQAVLDFKGEGARYRATFKVE
ncbi:hypothetical protein [Nocardia rhizosphaerihabitans]|nr:hypothetical protein [Nocardia rhizosphaerihabitans]